MQINILYIFIQMIKCYLWHTNVVVASEKILFSFYRQLKGDLGVKLLVQGHVMGM